MASRNQNTAEQDSTRLRTRAGNVNVHPGNVLKTSRTRRPAEVIQKDKEEKQAKKDVKQRVREEVEAKEATAAQYIEEYHARQEFESTAEETAAPRQKPQGSRLLVILHSTSTDI